ncbi:hypothetical protein Scep_014394 [Stephania cephalantha]|uniref:Uncharacterized protein n=1 Tax=Stephania cephalantha TaxID=152367 RepID=A0AAP0J181_9MAGN
MAKIDQIEKLKRRYEGNEGKTDNEAASGGVLTIFVIFRQKRRLRMSLLVRRRKRSSGVKAAQRGRGVSVKRSSLCGAQCGLRGENWREQGVSERESGRAQCCAACA